MFPITSRGLKGRGFLQTSYLKRFAFHRRYFPTLFCVGEMSSFSSFSSSSCREYIVQRDGQKVMLPRNCNQAKGIGEFAIDFVHGKLIWFPRPISNKVLDTIKAFHTDSVLCALSAIALKTNAPTVLRNEALEYLDSSKGACIFGNKQKCATEKAVVANSSACREWDSNGTVFGYNPKLKNHQAGEYGHNDFYPVVIAACQANKHLNGMSAVRGMLCLDEIRGRLCEVFSLKTYKIDHVVHGAIASAAVYGALMGATPEQIESGIGMVVAHYIPYRAIRAGKQLSDSKGASAALSSEIAVLSMKRSMNGFVGPKDIFRNPEAIFQWNENQADGGSPFNLIFTHSGDDFSVCGMHFKLGLYEHQSAGALEGLINLLCANPDVCKNPENIENIIIKAYEPAFGIIGDPAKRDPRTRQSADHSMVYIVATLLRKALEIQQMPHNPDEAWCRLMLSPYDYGKDALLNSKTRGLMELISFVHGGKEYDDKYPDGIPTSIQLKMKDGRTLDSGLVMYPAGHARNTTANLKAILEHKFKLLGSIAADKLDLDPFIQRLEHLEDCTPSDLESIYYIPAMKNHPSVD